MIIERSGQFKRDVKLMKKRGKDIVKLRDIVEALAAEKKLPTRCRDHALIGNYVNSRECHIEPDWLLIYTQIPQVLRLERTGSHADLFR